MPLSTATAEHDRDRDRRLDDVLAAYLDEVEAGSTPDRRAWLARYPDLAVELSDFFANHDHFGRIAAPLRPDILPYPTVETTPDCPRIGYFGDYELIRELARGGMGVVYEVRQVSLDRVLALKMILDGRLAGEAEVRRFRLEAEAAARLDHPNIVPIHEVGEHEGRHYFSMKLVSGGSLAAFVPQYLADPRAAARLVAEVARAVHYAHRRGILHRDLKPANILLDRDGRPHVSDFGLARRVEADSDLTRTGAILGTPSYMAPEQAEGRRDAVTTASDVHALGAILFELLAGRPPYRGETVLETLRQVREMEPVHPRSLNPMADRDLSTIALKCLEKDPDRRYHSAEALAAELDRWQNGLPIHARPVTHAERALKWARRRPTAAALLVVALIATLAIGATVRGLAANLRLRGDVREAGLAQQRESSLRLQAVAELQEADTRRRAAEVEAYFNHIAAAQKAWSENDPAEVDRLLDECPPRLRRWEWGYLKRLLHSERLSIRGRPEAVSCGVAFGPTVSVLACPEDHSGVAIRDLSKNEKICTFLCPDGSALGLAFDRQGSRLAVAGTDGSVRIGDAVNCETTQTLAGHSGRATSVAFGPEGAGLASGGADGTVRVWDLATGHERRVFRGHVGDVFAVAAAPNGRRIASAGRDGTVRLWDLEGSSEGRLLGRHGEAARSVAFSADGVLLASSGADRFVRVWDVDKGRQLIEFPAADHRVDAVAFSPDGTRIATGGLDRSVRVWDSANGRELLSFRGHTAPVFSVAFSADGNLIAAADQGGAVKVWDALSGQEARVLRGTDAWAGGVAFSPDGTLVAAGSHGAVALWDARTSRSRGTLEGMSTISAFAFAPDGRLAIVGVDRTVRVYAPNGGAEILTLRDDNGIASVAFSTDGKVIATGGGEAVTVVHDLSGKNPPREPRPAAVILRDATSGKLLRRLTGHGASIHSLVFRPDGRVIATASADHTVRIWDLAGADDPVVIPTPSAVFAVAYHPDGKRLAAAGSDGIVRVWDAASGRELFALPGHDNWVVGLSFSPDGSRLASAGWDQTVRLWDINGGRSVLTLRGHTDRVHGVSFRPDGRALASASADRTVRLWETDERFTPVDR
jgi:eukaryotic-like serine/threonine-protein kinase